MKKRWMACVIALALVFGMLPAQAAAGTVTLDLSAGSIVIEQSESGDSYTYTQGENVITGGNVCIIRQTDDSTGSIYVYSGTVKMTLAGVNASYASVSKGAALELTLVRSNEVGSVYTAGTTTINGTGSLAANGITVAGELIINNGEVTSTGPAAKAGICVYEEGALTINGGIVTAEGGDGYEWDPEHDDYFLGGAGIGGNGASLKYAGTSYERYEYIPPPVGAITINGGTVTATAGHYSIDHYPYTRINAPSIGGDEGGVITVTGGSVDAGTIVGYAWQGGSVTITGGSVDANFIGGDITINGGTVNARLSGTITIENGTVTATGDSSSRTAIGGEITISGGTVTARGYEGSSVGGNGIYASSITISGGTVTATGGRYCNGIYSESVTISGGTVTATGSHYCAGIIGGSITIAGTAEVTATGGDTGSGIHASGAVTITDTAKVTATGYYHAIGNQYSLNNESGCSSITIGDDVTLELSHTHPEGSDYQERIYDLTLSSEAAALVGNAPAFTTIARGASGIVSYQWQTSTDNSSWTDCEGATSAACTVPMTAELNGGYFRCKVTNGFGNVAYTDAARAWVLAFSQQPSSLEVGVDEWVALEAAATCDSVTYHWERSYDGGATWVDVPGEIYDVLMVSATLSDNSALYRCVITASNGDELASDPARIIVNTDAVTYSTDYYLEQADGSYAIAERATVESEAGAAVTAAEKTFEHYVENIAKGTHSGTVAADNSLVLSRYYDRMEYTLTFATNGGTALPAVTAKHGAAITAPDDTSRPGYTFDGWYADKELTTEFIFGKMPAGDTTVYAKWTDLGEGRGVEYTIDSLSFRLENSDLADDIPQAGFYAEVGVTNLDSVCADVLVLVAYDENGRMVNLWSEDSIPAAGQEDVLSVYIDNSNGKIAELRVFMLSSLGGTPLAQMVSSEK